jgi:hypothetical protein
MGIEMKVLRNFLLTMIAVLGLSVAASAQKKPDNPPPKPSPPVVKPGKPEKPPQKPQKPQKPSYAFVNSAIIIEREYTA